MCRVKINKAFYPKLPWNIGHLPKKKALMENINIIKILRVNQKLGFLH